MKLHYSIILCLSYLICVFASEFTLRNPQLLNEEEFQKEQLKRDFLSLLSDTDLADSGTFDDIKTFNGPIKDLKQNIKAKLLEDFSSTFPSIGYDAQLNYVSLEGLLKLQKRANESILGGEILLLPEASLICNSFSVGNIEDEQDSDEFTQDKRVNNLKVVVFKYLMLRGQILDAHGSDTSEQMPQVAMPRRWNLCLPWF
jgi:hypothetical protein